MGGGGIATVKVISESIPSKSLSIFSPADTPTIPLRDKLIHKSLMQRAIPVSSVLVYQFSQ